MDKTAWTHSTLHTMNHGKLPENCESTKLNEPLFITPSTIHKMGQYFLDIRYTHYIKKGQDCLDTQRHESLQTA